MRPWLCIVVAAVLVVPGLVRGSHCLGLGGDPDGDGICDDGSASTVVGDLPCSCQPGDPPSCTVGCDDNCRLAYNPAQLDRGGAGASGPDGQGDACQCGDVSADGRADIADAARYARELDPGTPSPGFPGIGLCNVTAPVACDQADLDVLRNELAGLSPGIQPVCAAASGCSSGADCGVGFTCDSDGVCRRALGGPCSYDEGCSSRTCCAGACTNTADDPAHCGGCGIQCQPAHGTNDCLAGLCVPSCDPLWGNCDGVSTNGCEQTLTTLSNCGGCGVTCQLPGASETCATGTCTITSCEAGFSDCDDVDGNGCEIEHGAPVNSCGTADFLGSFAADTACGVFCSQSNQTLVATRSGWRSGWFRARASETSTCCAGLRHTVQLVVPGGVDFDLHAWSSCGTLLASSTNGTGQTEALTVTAADDCGGADSSFDYWIEVRHSSGESCSSWTLQLFAQSC